MVYEWSSFLLKDINYPFRFPNLDTFQVPFPFSSRHVEDVSWATVSTLWSYNDLITFLVQVYSKVYDI